MICKTCAKCGKKWLCSGKCRVRKRNICYCMSCMGINPRVASIYCFPFEVGKEYLKEYLKAENRLKKRKEKERVVFT